MTDISDAGRFYVRIQGGNEYAKIEAEMNRFNPASVEDLEKPIKKGTICAARFSVDQKWYRAKVIGSIGKGEIEVQFLDFGNTDVANSNTGDLKRLPESMLQYEPQAKPASLAFLRTPKASSDHG
jgi:staphylococcal nuclease domain-containing protein 1